MSNFKAIVALIKERNGVHDAGPNQLVPTRFTIGAYENEAGGNLDALVVLWDASTLGLTVGEVLPHFAEEFAAVVETPDGVDQPHIRALMKCNRASYVGSVVFFHGTPITPKVALAAGTQLNEYTYTSHLYL